MAIKPVRYTATLVLLIAVLSFGVNASFLVLARIYALGLSEQLALLAVAAVLVALCIAWVTFGITPIVKEVLSTFRTMTRLESLSHPLLLRLSHEAPGTYHHSLQVGTLANRAARAIGADALLARLGGYYHDIGKLTEPQFFIENQQGATNPLDAMSPRQAARVIIAHIDDGLAIGQQYRLPNDLLALIAQHTGTTTVRYFLEKARAGKKQNLNEDDFRYPGPKPQTREAGIVMLADSIEAKGRLLREPNRAAFQRLVAETIEEKQADGQLELAGFSTTDLNKLHQEFVETLITMMHQRIAYPSQQQGEYNEGAL